MLQQSYQHRLIRLHEVISRTGLSRSTIYTLIKENKFPRQISLSGHRSVGWLEHEITAWINERIDISRHVGGAL